MNAQSILFKPIEQKMKIPFPIITFKVLALFCLVLSLTSCTQLFTIVPSGNINEDIKFEFYKDEKNEELIELKVQSVILETKRFRRWRKIWSIWAKDEPTYLKNIKYGETPTGMVETMKPKKLYMREFYKVSVSGMTSSGATFYAVEVFIMNEDGGIITIKNGQAMMN
jgi:hypothetical protein